MQVRLLSWNIWVKSYFEHVQDFLKKSNADIIGLQEVSGNDTSRDTVSLLTNLGYKHVFSPQLRLWAGNGRTDGPAIFTKYEITQSNKYILSEENGVGAVQADIDVNGETIHFFCTHLSHTHQVDSVVQIEQIDKLLNLIPSKHSVLMGDFNALPTSETILKVKERLLDVDPNNQATWSVYPEGCEVCQPQKIDIRLDYIFTTKDLKTHAYNVEESKGSDHLPISVILEI